MGCIIYSAIVITYKRNGKTVWAVFMFSIIFSREKKSIQAYILNSEKLLLIALSLFQISEFYFLYSWECDPVFSPQQCSSSAWDPVASGSPTSVYYRDLQLPWVSHRYGMYIPTFVQRFCLTLWMPWTMVHISTLSSTQMRLLILPTKSGASHFLWSANNTNPHFQIQGRIITKNSSSSMRDHV